MVIKHYSWGGGGDNTILSVMVANNGLPVIAERNSGNNESTIIDGK